jgi:tRNA A37 methylthiotransferase MiaB
MAKVTNFTSALTELPLMASAIHGKSAATAQVPSSAPENHKDTGRCVQDLDPSGTLSALLTEPCNLECSFCVIRWTARRILHQQDA